MTRPGKCFWTQWDSASGSRTVTRRPVEQDPARTDASRYEEGAARSARVLYCGWALNVMILEIYIMRA
jgi:hypothetical protein